MQAEPTTQTSAPPRRLTRRALLRGCAGGLAALAAGAAYAHYVEPFWPALERVSLDLPCLDPALVGLRIIQLSDLHLATRVSARYLREQLQRCRDLAPDLFVLTGDYITNGDQAWLRELGSLMSVLRAPLGAFAVLGNHDFAVYSDARGPGNLGIAARISEMLAGAGVTVLRNESHVLTKGGAALQLAGLEDLWSGECDPEQAFVDVDRNLPCIALAHNPDSIDVLRDTPCAWILSGHTHGGQVRIPFFGAPILPVRHREYDEGLFAVASQRLYVNRGLGYLLRVRFNCRPEITEFTLTRRV